MEKMRELFIDELVAVQGGASSDGPYTTMACCEEGPFGCCGVSLDDILKP
ncbi:MAG TPA: hypothetical protein VHN37_14705 [Actinomycetota bacterium]|nr:hypothetical protein [Actinomycetota bacterium]